MIKLDIMIHYKIKNWIKMIYDNYLEVEYDLFTSFYFIVD